MPTGQTNKIGATRDLNPESQEKPKKWREIGTHKGETVHREANFEPKQHQKWKNEKQR